MKRKSNKLSYLGHIYALARPYGRKKMAVVFAFALAQGMMQVVGVTSIFPFLALASDPDQFKSSKTGSYILGKLPAMEDSEFLIASGVIAILLLLISNLVNIGAEISRNRYSQQFGHWLRSTLIKKIVSQPYEYFFSHDTSRLIKIITGDVFTFTNGVFLPLLDTVARVVIVILLTVMLFLINPGIAMGASLFFGVFYLIVFMGLKGIRKRISDGALNASRGTIKETQQLLTGIKPVKAQDSENYFFKRFEVHSKKMADLMTWVNVFGNGPRYLIEPLAFGGLVAVVLLLSGKGGDLVGILPSLGVMALAGYRLLPAMQLIYSQLNQLTTMRYAFEEVNEEFFKDYSSASIDSPQTASSSLVWRKSLRLENVSYSYSIEKQSVFRDLTVELAKGNSIGVIGASGSGKSTLADLVMGLLIPRFGQIKIDGVPLTESNVRSWRKHVAYVPQEAFLIDDTIASNVAFGIPNDEIDRDHLEEVCAKAQILSFIKNDLADGFDSIVGERGIRLSGGQRQRIGLARALYRKPSLLVLDEATSALDDDTESSVVNAIDSLRHKITLLVIAHRLSTVENCDGWWKVTEGRVEVVSSLTSDLLKSIAD